MEERKLHTIDEQVKSILKKRKMTIADLAKTSGIDAGNLSKSINGKYSVGIDRMAYIADCVDCQIILVDKKERYTIALSCKNDYCTCVDRIYGIICIFEVKNFDENQRFTFVDNTISSEPNDVARLCNELATWLKNNHNDLI